MSKFYRWPPNSHYLVRMKWFGTRFAYLSLTSNCLYLVHIRCILHHKITKSSFIYRLIHAKFLVQFFQFSYLRINKMMEEEGKINVRDLLTFSCKNYKLLQSAT